MARPEKQGLDYFPLDVDIDSDDKVYLIQAKHGIAGFGILIKLFIKIYRNGYYLRFAEREEIIFAAQNNIDINVCKNLINDCINESVFDKSIYNKYKILTSRGIQRRYFEISERRKKTELIKDICLIDTTKYNNLVNVNINGVNDNINPAETENSRDNDNIYRETETETETETKQKLKTTYAASDEKTNRLPPKENKSSYVQPDVLSELPVKTTQDVLSELPAKITPDVLSELPVKTRDALIEPSLGQKKGETKCAVKPLPGNRKISFDCETAKFTDVTELHVARWKDAYPAVDVLTELRQAELWADTNPANRKSNWERFIVNWLKRSQDRARPARLQGKGGSFGQFGNSKPTHVGEATEPKGKYADQVDEVIYTDA